MLTQALAAETSLAGVQEAALADKNDALNTELQKANDMVKAEKAALAQSKALAAEQEEKDRKKAAAMAAASRAAKQRAICFQLAGDSAIISQAAAFIVMIAKNSTNPSQRPGKRRQKMWSRRSPMSRWFGRSTTPSAVAMLNAISHKVFSLRCQIQPPTRILQGAFWRRWNLLAKGAQDFGNKIVAQIAVFRKALKCE